MGKIINNTTFILEEIDDTNIDKENNNNYQQENSNNFSIHGQIEKEKEKESLNNNEIVIIKNEKFHIQNNFEDFEEECNRNNLTEDQRLSLFKAQNPDLFERYKQKKDIIRKQNENYL